MPNSRPFSPPQEGLTYKEYLKKVRDKIKSQCTNRPLKHFGADYACVKAIAQAAINVELFTIPLYMTAAYSVQGTHQINKGNDLYEGRQWPGSAPAVGKKLTVNEQVFNKVYSVFIEEMLHLQLASNMASKLGFTPDFTSGALQTPHHGWHCYGKKAKYIPHLLELKDWHGSDLKLKAVELLPMNEKQVELFLAIEEKASLALKNLTNKKIPRPDGIGKVYKYFEPAPFDWFTPSMDESDLPLFGSIGHLYLCYWSYLEIEYSDGSTLLEKLTTPVQVDKFNNVSKRPKAQYPGIAATIPSSSSPASLDDLKSDLMNNIDAITDQGEGGPVVSTIMDVWGDRPWAKSYRQITKGDIEEKFQPSKEALKKDYPGYNDKGVKTKISGSAQARSDAGDKDHHELFLEVKKLILENPSSYVTWDKWHKNSKNKWTPSMLGKDRESKYKLPSTNDIAGALNRLNDNKHYKIFSRSAVGAIKGITTQLNRCWSNPSVFFPGPAMTGSGDRVSICWAVTGKAPDLSKEIKSQKKGNELYHACQGMHWNDPKSSSSVKHCASELAYHTCRGSNECKTQGGCGFVQEVNGGGNCAHFAATGIKSATGDNHCAQLGGCAVPISASQLFPTKGDKKGGMQLYSFGPKPKFKAIKTGDETIQYKFGHSVYDMAWEAYCKANGLKKKDHPTPKPSDIRLALPPST
jgi:hypothetical protein